MALFILISDISSAYSRVGEAAVIDRSGHPCFTLAKVEIERASKDGIIPITEISVSEEENSNPKTLWEFYSRSEGDLLKLNSNDCIEYGTTLKGREPEKAQPLMNGRQYSVTIRIKRRNSTDPTLFYEKRFCMKNPTKNTQEKVIQIEWSPQKKRWDDDACTGR
jgi:hypothetical protein